MYLWVVFIYIYNMKHLNLILLALLFSANAIAQGNPNFHFKKIQVDEGLSENTIYCILQDSKGFMWFGTKDGLNRYDGNTFRVFRNSSQNPHSIGNNFIRSIVELNDSIIYVGTDAGLYIMNTVNEAFIKVNEKTEHGISLTTAVNSLFLDKNNNVWIGSMHQGIFAYNIKDKTLKHVDVANNDLGANATWVIYGDRSGTIWAGNRLGLLRYNPTIEKFEFIDGLYSASENSENEILYILEDNTGNLWLGTWSDGIRLYNKQTNHYTSYYGTSTHSEYISHVRSILQYTEKTLMIGSDDGLYLFNTDNKSIVRIDIPQLRYSLSDQNVYSIKKDNEGGIWIGTYFGGLNYLNTSTQNTETYHPSILHWALSGKAVSQFCEDEHGNLWIATEDGGINYFDVKTKRITQPVKTSYHNTHALIMDNNDLWIGTFSRGIDVYNTKSKRLINIRNNPNNENSLNDDCVFSLYKTKDGNIYAGTPIGLNRYDRSKRNFERIPEASGFIYDVKEDEYGNLWVATYGSGAIKLDANTKQWVHYDTIQSRNNPIVGSKLTGIYIDNQKRLIFSSEGRGIFIYDYKLDNFQNISETNGLPNNVVYGILDDPYGNLWISCNKGLVCFNTASPQNYRLYNKEDGLQSNQFNYKSSYKSKDGKFYFGGINGFNSFYPQELSESNNNIIPPVEITHLRLLGNDNADIEKDIQTKINKKQKIKLPYNSSLNISYVSLSYISQSKNEYACKMDGVDNEWNYVGNNKNITYVNLSSGSYVFNVKASNNNGLWNETGSQIEIEILPPFWMSLPAKIFYFVLFILTIYSIIYFSRRRDWRKQRQHLEAFKTEQETLAFKSKIEFFTTIAHEVRTPLSLIKAPLEEIINSDDGNSETKQNLSIIEKNCERLTVLINQLLDFRKMDPSKYIVNPETINLYQHINELYDRFKKTAQSKHINFELHLPEDKGLSVQSDADALTKIVGNLLTNALKYTKNKISLKLISNNDKSFTISVEDNGRGIPDEYKKLIFDPFYQIQSNDKNIGVGLGLSLVKNLSEVLKGMITVSDGDKEGSIFSFTFSNIAKEYLVPNDEANTTYNNGNERGDEKTNDNNTILVVDDNPEITSFIKKSLQGLYVVDKADDATKAFELLEERNYDLIISDIMMPGIDGLLFTKKLKSDINYSHIPIILLSAKTENSIKIEGLRSGAEVFIEKPFSMSYLRAQIASLLENRKTLLDSFNRTPFASYSTLVNNKNDEIFLSKLNEEIEKHISDENFSVESLTDIIGVSRSNLQRKLKSISGVTPGDYLRNYRLKRACKLLLESDLRINEVAFYVGFNSASYFTKAFIKCYKMSPKEFVKKYTDK